MPSQEWDDAEFCDLYEKTWEISLSEVHYGWLSPGENSLELIKNELTPQSNVLDVGCGLAQNLVALANLGANCYGLDISASMLSKANKIVSDNKLEEKITLSKGDMREFAAFEDIKFDIILSIYSMEYLEGVQQLKAVIHNLYKRLKPGGIFIMCFSHPLQAHRYPELMNKSVPQGAGKYRTFNFSIKDATGALFKAGFSIERVVEQQTKNPSQLTYEIAKEYPYHFREGHSPCIEKYDDISNHAPHTIIYKARRHKDPTKDFPKQHKLNIGYRELWGYKRKIIKYKTLSYLNISFNALHLAPMDNLLGITDVLSFVVIKDDFDIEHNLIDIQNSESEETISIPTNSVLGLIHRKLLNIGLSPIYKIYSVESGDKGLKERKPILHSILGLKETVAYEFKTSKLGLLTFVNGQEPSMGELPIDVIQINPSDKIELIYLALMESQGKAPNNNQISLF